MTPPFPARLHIILAREAHTAIVIRRGPSKCCSTFSWDRRKDTFRYGQLFHGRIYERRCDLSPEGKRFIYFAMNGRYHTKSSGSWTAISNAPNLTAAGFWPKGDCWYGGGLFVDNGSYWLNFGQPTSNGRTPGDLRQVEEPPFDMYFGGECPGVYYPRLIRDGWTLMSRSRDSRDNCVTHFEKQLPKGWTLRKHAHETCDKLQGKGCYFDEHELVHQENRIALSGKDWDWCDWDEVRGRLVWTTAGCLFAASIRNSGLSGEKMLHDFNRDRFPKTSL